MTKIGTGRGASRRPYTHAPYPFGGTVYGVILNDTESLTRMGTALTEPPHKAPPQAPVLYIKPRNTVVGDGAVITPPGGKTCLEVGGTLALVMDRAASRLTLETALDPLAGFTLAADFMVSGADYYRPAIKEKCFDGSCALGPDLVSGNEVGDPAALTVKTFVDGALVHERKLSDLVRSVSQLMVDITEFMTLHPGDVVLTGVPLGAPIAAMGSDVTVEIEGLGRLTNHIVGGRS
ncbi:MAG: fumarylacetoacetate hydrolase family protein [Rhodospirillum sp.]|nr:fumarylacetoacetate hydrolase family protein [Rhodospirillum sp.]MCF8500579.1 fumarylacetoacetate hydrolase family protein [Rhodospirillum sp.]